MPERVSKATTNKLGYIYMIQTQNSNHWYGNTESLNPRKLKIKN